MVQYPLQKRASFRIVERLLYCKNVHSKMLERRYGIMPRTRVVWSFNQHRIPENGRKTDEPFQLLPCARSVQAIVLHTNLYKKTERAVSLPFLLFQLFLRIQLPFLQFLSRKIKMTLRSFLKAHAISSKL